ncbi:hypothetical protein PHLCEN_2v7213 [Hermanssonia centrifuga]|uniref:Uncharacterized protein n=1 Tax=Hermanssonia centrifuga TaxID=98765 RepID=A0A2R6NXC8_9APHY|nr:hypothetical protein PHLCEN_2v7213 [Hermanssonia centrifuga]
MSKSPSSPPSTPSRTPLARPPSSPLRPISPTPVRSTSGPLTNTLIGTRRSSVPHGMPGIPSSPTPPPPGIGQKTRARDLLRKHYGLGIGPPPSLQGKSSADPMDLDSTGFDAKAYYEQLITTSSLPTLLRRENDLLTGASPALSIIF